MIFTHPFYSQTLLFLFVFMHLKYQIALRCENHFPKLTLNNSTSRIQVTILLIMRCYDLDVSFSLYQPFSLFFFSNKKMTIKNFRTQILFLFFELGKQIFTKVKKHWVYCYSIRSDLFVYCLHSFQFPIKNGFFFLKKGDGISLSQLTN